MDLPGFRNQLARDHGKLVRFLRRELPGLGNLKFPAAVSHFWIEVVVPRPESAIAWRIGLGMDGSGLCVDVELHRENRVRVLGVFPAGAGGQLKGSR